MRQQNMVYTGPMIDTEIEHAQFHPEPYIIPYGRITSFPPPVNSHGPLTSGVTFMAAPPGARLVPVPVNPGLHNQLPFTNNQVMDRFHGPFNGKIDKGFHVNIQYSYPAPASAPGQWLDHRGAMNRTAGALDLNLGLQLMPMSHGGQPQPLQVVPSPWFDQQFCGIPYMQGYTNGNPVAFVHPPPPPMPPLSMVPLQNGVELVPRFVRPAPPIGVRVYQPRSQDLMIESTSRHRGFSHLRVLPEDGVAMLDFANYGHRVDHHRDMRLDIDHMSYEELLALGEQIGNAGSGLSDDFILVHLKTRIFTSSHLENVSSTEQLNFCTICQMDYNDQEKIGILDCNHEYHAHCIKNWLVVKNTCPVCKCTGLATQEKELGNLQKP